MGSKILEPTDYRYNLGDKYGRAKCSNCNKLRRINAHWKDTNRILCAKCCHLPNLVFAYSIRGGKVKIS